MSLAFCESRWLGIPSFKITCTTEQTKCNRSAVSFFEFQGFSMYCHPSQKACFHTETISFMFTG